MYSMVCLYDNICFYIFIITYIFTFFLSYRFFIFSQFLLIPLVILEKFNSCFPTSKNSFRVFRGSFDKNSNKTATILTHFTEMEQQKIIKSSSKIANFIFFYVKREFGGSFCFFLKKYPDVPTHL